MGPNREWFANHRATFSGFDPQKVAGNRLKSAGKIPKCISMMFPQSRILARATLLCALAFGAIESSGQDDNQGLAALRNQIKAQQGPRWVTEKTLIATNKVEFDHALDCTIKEDWESLNQSINEGKLRYVGKGEQVQLTDPHTFYPLSQIRLTGDDQPWIIAKEFLSDKPIASLDEELKASRGNPSKANVNQKPLKGALSQVKILLGKPLDDWEKVYGSRYGSGTVNARAKNWQVGCFWITGDFTGEPAVATRVRIASQDGKPDLTLAEAKQIVASVGLIANKPDPDDKTFVDWGNQRDPISASFATDDRVLEIFSSDYPKN